jgi:hypothetical protein
MNGPKKIEKNKSPSKDEVYITCTYMDVQGVANPIPLQAGVKLTRSNHRSLAPPLGQPLASDGWRFRRNKERVMLCEVLYGSPARHRG